MATVLIISDLQAPFTHPRTIPFLANLKKIYNPNEVVCIGDEADFKFLKFASINDPHSSTAQHSLALKTLQGIYDLFPVVKVCHSNHVRDRLNYACAQGGIPEDFLKGIREILGAPPGWEWDDYWEIDNVRYEHGHHLKGGLNVCIKAVERRHQSVVFGHWPLLESRNQRVRGKNFFGMCVGALVVPDTDKLLGYGMSYAKHYGQEMPLGAGVVVDGIYSIPIPLID